MWEEIMNMDAWYKTMLWYRYTEMYVHTAHKW